MQRFFQWSLLTPYALGALGLLLSIAHEGAAAALFGPLMFGGIPYIPFAIGVSALIQRCTTELQLVTLSLLAPIAFVPFVIGFVFAIGSTPQMTAADFFNMRLLIFAAFTIAYGYAYVGFAWLSFALFSRAPFHPANVRSEIGIRSH